jgi:hypothetical protein
MQGGSRPDPAATIMTEDAKAEENTAGGPCGAYIETPCEFASCRVLLLMILYQNNAIYSSLENGNRMEARQKILNLTCHYPSHIHGRTKPQYPHDYGW